MADNIMDALNQAYENEADICIINPDTRTIDVPSKWRFLGVTSDEKSKRVPFKCPRYVDDIDLMDYSLYINYENANGIKDAHHITDVTLDGDFITFTWLLSRQVTAYRGDVHYILCAKIVEDTEIINEWNTVPAVGTVSEGLEATSQIVDRDEDVIEQILLDIKSLEEEPRWDSEIIETSVINKSILKPENLGKVYKYTGTVSMGSEWMHINPFTHVTTRITVTINPNDTFVIIKYSFVDDYPLVINEEGLAKQSWVTNEINNIPVKKITESQVNVWDLDTGYYITPNGKSTKVIIDDDGTYQNFQSITIYKLAEQTNFHGHFGRSELFGITLSQSGGTHKFWSDGFLSTLRSDLLNQLINEQSPTTNAPSTKAVYNAIQAALYVDSEGEV